MRWLFGLIAAGPLVLACGCGGGGTSVPVAAEGTTNGPHGGLALPLPGDKGYAELVVEKVPTAKGKPATKGVGPKIAVYFLGADVKTPLAPAPTNVSVRVVPPTGEPSTVTLAAEGARFVSTPGDFDYDELRGEVTATVDGQTVTVSFSLR